MTRQEALEWCKQRALEYLDRGDKDNAWASMMSDMNKHPELANHSAIKVGMMMIMAGQLSSIDEMRKFILGFN